MPDPMQDGSVILLSPEDFSSDEDAMKEASDAYDSASDTPRENRYVDEGDEWLPDTQEDESSSSEGESKEVPIGAESPIIAREPHTSDDSEISGADDYDADDDEKEEPQEAIEGPIHPVEDISEDQALQLELLKRLPVSKSDYAELIELAAREYRLTHP
jgi:hypothetical protein